MDGLEVAAGVPPNKVMNLHGKLKTYCCQVCKCKESVLKLDEWLDRVVESPVVHCPKSGCHG